MKTIAELFDLRGRGAVVTGGAAGIGQAIALRLAEAGAGVMVTDIDMEAAGKTVDLIRTRGGKAEAILADAASADDAGKVMAATLQAFGGIDILVNNAGIYTLMPAMEVPESLFDKVLTINLKGPFLYAQAAAAEMIKAGRGGKIINIASMDGLHPNGDAIHYNASKGGLIMVTKALALELAPHNILVNTVAPGGVVTPGSKKLAMELQQRGYDFMARGKKSKERTPLGRIGEPDDIARVVLFAASAASDYMTGTILLVDGGYLLS